MASQKSKRQPSLRDRAEAAWQDRHPDLSATSREGLAQLVHELKVHEIELELQNEELRRAQAELEESRRQLGDLYDFAPVGYLTVRQDTVIAQANLTVAAMLGVVRARLNGQHFTRFLSRKSQDDFYLAQRGTTAEGTSWSGELVLRKAAGDELPVSMEMVRAPALGSVPAWRCVMTDITRRQAAERALRASEDRYHDGLTRELEDTKRLQSASTQLIQVDDIEALYTSIVETAMHLTRADCGSVQSLDADRNHLHLLAWKGFHPGSAVYWQVVRADSPCSCGEALRQGSRIVIEDIEHSSLLVGSEDYDQFRRSGIRAMQSTPLMARSGTIVGMISTHWHEAHRPTDRELGLLDVLARQAADLIERKRGEDALRRAHDVLEQRVIDRTKDLHDVLRRLVDAQEEERKRIARDIHDQLGQQMTALRLHLDRLLAKRKAGRDRDRIAGLVVMLCEDLDRHIDSLVWSLRPATLEHLGLSDALGELVQGFTDRFGIPAEYQSMSMDGPRLPPDTEAHVYRIAQEALHNVYKHASASRVAVSFENARNRFVLTVEDDGCGFLVAEASMGMGLGLVSMRERAALIGGSLDVLSAPGHGTTVSLQVPVS
jgi:PAS domain S-box-containing protein